MCARRASGVQQEVKGLDSDMALRCLRCAVSRESAQLLASELQKEVVEEIPVLRPRVKAAQAIPEMFMLPPDAKAQLTGEALTSLQQLETAALHQNELCRLWPSSVLASAAVTFRLAAHVVTRPGHV